MARGLGFRPASTVLIRASGLKIITKFAYFVATFPALLCVFVADVDTNLLEEIEQ